MRQPIQIAGRKVELEWTQRTARLFSVRCSKAGVDPFKLISKPKTRVYGIAAFIWAILPAEEYARHETPEDLFAEITEAEWEGDEIANALTAIFEQMAPQTAEKKSTSMKSPSPGSNSA